MALKADAAMAGRQAFPAAPAPAPDRSPRLELWMAWSSSSTTAFRCANRRGASFEASIRATCSGVVSRMSGGAVALALAAGRRGVAGAGFDAQEQPHLVRPGRRDCARHRPPAPSAARCRACAGDGAAFRAPAPAAKLDQAGQKPGQRLAAAGGRHQQHRTAGTGMGQHLELMGARGPAPRREPVANSAWQGANRRFPRRHAWGAA